MKFIATSDFVISPEMKDRITIDEASVKDLQHPNMIHKGARFSIGTSEVLKDLRKPDQELIGVLTYAQRIATLQNESAVKLIDEEVTREKNRLAAAEKANEKANGVHAIAALTALLQKASAAK